MKTNKFNYKLKNNYIATEPAEPRDSSKLLVLNRENGEIKHKIFHEITDIFSANDILVFNETKVIPAKLMGIKDTGGKTEILLLEENNNIWKCLAKNIKQNCKSIIFAQNLKAKIIKKSGKFVYLKFNLSRVKFDKYLAKYGQMPIPPYIAKNRPHQIDFKASQELKTAYNTIYAKNKGSVAAPTAGLHFTKETFSALRKKNINTAKLTLHVGLGTFESVKTDSLFDHKIHSEYYFISPSVAQYLNEQKRSGKRIIAVGTTTTRVLESIANEDGYLNMKKLSGSTSLFIIPLYKFKFVDGLVTNFHLPKSTLLSLVSAFVSCPNTSFKFINFRNSVLGKAYKQAIESKYRFYSFGDAMLII